MTLDSLIPLITNESVLLVVYCSLVISQFLFCKLSILFHKTIFSCVSSHLGRFLQDAGMNDIGMTQLTW